MYETSAKMTYRGGMSDRDQERPASWYNTESDYSTSSLGVYNIAPPYEETVRRNLEYEEKRAREKIAKKFREEKEYLAIRDIHFKVNVKWNANIYYYPNPHRCIDEYYYYIHYQLPDDGSQELSTNIPKIGDEIYPTLYKRRFTGKIIEVSEPKKRENPKKYYDHCLLDVRFLSDINKCITPYRYIELKIEILEYAKKPTISIAPYYLRVEADQLDIDCCLYDRIVALKSGQRGQIIQVVKRKAFETNRENILEIPQELVVELLI